MEAQDDNRSIDLLYQEIVSPENFYQNFKSKEEFENWLDLGSEDDLNFTLEKFEQEEMYEPCSIIRDFITKKFKQ